MSEIHLPIAGARSLRLNIAFLARGKRRRWPPILGLGLAAMFGLGVWTAFLMGIWVLI